MAQTKEIQVTIKVSAETLVRLKDKETLLKAVSDLPTDDQNRILQLATNKKALASLKENWGMLQSLFN